MKFMHTKTHTGAVMVVFQGQLKSVQHTVVNRKGGGDYTGGLYEHKNLVHRRVQWSTHML